MAKSPTTGGFHDEDITGVQLCPVIAQQPLTVTIRTLHSIFTGLGGMPTGTSMWWMNSVRRQDCHGHLLVEGKSSDDAIAAFAFARPARAMTDREFFDTDRKSRFRRSRRPVPLV